ncbi:hypothetical protein, partial [Yersinia pestis]
ITFNTVAVTQNYGQAPVTKNTTSINTRGQIPPKHTHLHLLLGYLTPLSYCQFNMHCADSPLCLQTASHARRIPVF